MHHKQIISTFTTKQHQLALIRYAQQSDASDLLHFINNFSLENTYTRFAGEQQTLQEEQEYLSSEITKMEKGDAVKLFCTVNDTLAGVCDIHRDTSLLTRKRHIGILGIIIGKEFRGQGLGEQLMHATLKEAQKKIVGIRMVQLDCFAANQPALSLYKKVGFTEVGRVPNALLHTGKLIDEVIMVKMLDFPEN